MKFIQKSTFKFLAGLWLAALMGLTHGAGGSSGTGRGYGEISDFGSIFVNGVEYDISTANIRISGNDNRPQSELKLGMAVRVEGTVNVGGVTGTATLVEYLGDVEGALDAAPVISGRNGSFTIHGLPIKTDSKTKFDTGVTLANLAAGQFVEVSGLFDANDGSFRATHIERFPMFRKLDLRGFISNVTPTSFTLGPSLVVNYNINDTRDFPLSGPANGMFVEVKANTEPVNGVVTATRVNRESSVLRSTDMQLGHVQGVAANVTAGGFVMGNQPIVTNAQTVFDGAPVSALANGAKAIASGPVVAGVMTAAAVTITPDLTAVLSRKTHGTAGSFDLPIALNTPINGAISVEPRAMGINHTLVFQFNGPITSIAAVTSKDAGGVIDVGTATFAIPSVPGNEIVVTLTGVADNKRATITLININKSGTDALVSIGFLIGDVTRSRAITAADISSVKARQMQPLSNTNCMLDVNLSGVIDAIDLLAVKARSGVVLVP